MTRPMRVATLLFFAIASLCLSLGAIVPAELATGAWHVPFDQVIESLTFVAPIIFVAWAIVEAVRGAV
jgi:hypothetical protein